MNILYPLDELICKHESCLERKFTAAPPEQLFQTATKLVHDEAVSLLMLAKPVDLRDSDTISKNLVDFVLVHKLGLRDRHWLLFCNSSLFLLFCWFYQVFYFHGVLVIALFENSTLLAILFGDDIDARPDFSKTTRS